MIDRLHREHDAALDRVLPDMRRVSFPESAPTLAPLARPVTPLVEGRADSRVNEIVDLGEVPCIVAKLVLHAEPAPSRRLRSGDWGVLCIRAVGLWVAGPRFRRLGQDRARTR